MNEPVRAGAKSILWFAGTEDQLQDKRLESAGRTPHVYRQVPSGVILGLQARDNLVSESARRSVEITL